MKRNGLLEARSKEKETGAFGRLECQDRKKKKERGREKERSIHGETKP